LTMPPISFARLSAISVVTGEPFTEGRVETIAVSPAPVPEPASIVLLGAGLLARAAQRRLFLFALHRRN
jgi:PEP-CTERM motif